MKKLLFCLGIASLLFACSQEKKPPMLSFDNTTIDIGNVSLSNPVKTCTIEFQNAGDSLLRMRGVLAQCDCEKVEIKSDSYFLEPHAKGQLTYTLNVSEFHDTLIHRELKVYSDTRGENPVILHVVAHVTE